jgi:hypothetical protein
MEKQIHIGIMGGAGYTGGELLRLLLNHPQVSIRFVHSKSNAGQPVYKVHTDLLGSTEMVFAEETSQDIDVLFLCLGHGESAKLLKETTFDPNIRIIDLANDFRLAKDAHAFDRHFVYGLPELQLDAIQSADNIANPGCFATAIQLGLLPRGGWGFRGSVRHWHHRLNRCRAITERYKPLQLEGKQYPGLQNTYTPAFGRDTPIAQPIAGQPATCCAFCTLAWRLHQGYLHILYRKNGNALG